MFYKKRIRSLFVQTFSNWELIIIDDGSSDNTEMFIKDYLCDPKVKYLNFIFFGDYKVTHFL